MTDNGGGTSVCSERGSPECFRTPSQMWWPYPPGPQVVEQVVANLGLLLIQLGEKVQKQREAAVVFLHLA